MYIFLNKAWLLIKNFFKNLSLKEVIFFICGSFLAALCLYLFISISILKNQNILLEKELDAKIEEKIQLIQDQVDLNNNKLDDLSNKKIVIKETIKTIESKPKLERSKIDSKELDKFFDERGF